MQPDDPIAIRPSELRQAMNLVWQDAFQAGKEAEIARRNTDLRRDGSIGVWMSSLIDREVPA